jgi:hypothetical protein
VPPPPSCPSAASKPSLLVALVCASVVASYNKRWLAQPLCRFLPAGGPSAAFISRLKARLLGALEKLLCTLTRRGRPPRPNLTSEGAGRTALLENPEAGRWFDTTAFVNPPSFTLGNVGRTLPDVRTPGTVNVDFSVIKVTQIRERLRLQFRAETFNIANHVNLGIPNTTFLPGPDGLNRSGTFGVITTAREARIGQLALKLIF